MAKKRVTNTHAPHHTHTHTHPTDEQKLGTDIRMEILWEEEGFQFGFERWQG